MAQFLKSLIGVSNKAANLARAIRSEHALFELLVQEKTGDAKNKRFVQDFKTLGDVLIQEMVKHDLLAQFPEMKDHIFGEESNEFTNTLGDSITVAVQSTVTDTSQLLSRVLDGNDIAADILAKVLHQEVDIPQDEALSQLTLEVDINSLAVWIDPIDSTAEYIKGISDAKPDGGIYSVGLQCATVLIGAYDRQSGKSVIGVVNQPFQHLDPATSKWSGRYIWGVACNGVRANSYSECQSETQAKANNFLAVLSPSEKEHIKSTISSINQSKYQYGSGAGYKALCVCDKLADVYVLSRGSTFKWDCCAPHAILNSMGGGMLDLQKALKVAEGEDIGTAEILYDKPDNSVWEPGQQWSNSGGVIAYWTLDSLNTFLKAETDQIQK
ncbi:inositol polyphosphate 1-phosphatase-like [Glandiceps talaboti]